jgi:hypothetical protein
LLIFGEDFRKMDTKQMLEDVLVSADMAARLTDDKKRSAAQAEALIAAARALAVIAYELGRINEWLESEAER